ncbi:tetratricopeptide repeat protein [Parvibaculum lavamentivorans]|nr:tetratricopeptide repeat protein [Parvibaculum lavamentivorans]
MGMAALLLMLAAFVPDARAEAMRVALSEKDGYGRMVFTAPGGEPSVRASISSGVLVIAFGKASGLDPDLFLRTMPRYFAMVRQDGNESTLRFALTTEFRLDVKKAENAVYVDLLPPDWAGEAPPLPADVVARVAAAEEAKQKAEEAARLAKAQGIVEPDAPPPGLAVRVVARDGMTRLVFDWNQPVLYSLVQRQGLATITFDRTAKVDLSSLRVDPPPYLSHASATEHDGRLAVILTLKPGVSIADFREDMGVVLDLKPAQGGIEDEAKAAAAALTDEKKAPAPRDIRPETARGAEEPAATAEAPEDVPPAEEMAAAPGKTNAMPQGGRPEGKAVVRIQPGRSGMDVIVAWPEPVGAAVFERAGRLWAVFDAALPMDISGIEAETSGPFGAPEVVRFEGGTALVLPLRERVLVGAIEEGASWRISAGETLTTTGRPIATSRDWRDDGRGSVTFDFAGARRILTVGDPLVRDTIVVATARGPVQSLQTARSYVEFQALQTAQGIAIVPVADDVNVAAAPDNVLVSRREGLTLSADDHRDGSGDSESASVASVPVTSLMNFEEWRKAPGETFTERRQHYLSRFVQAQAHELGKLRFEYGRFLLAYGLAPEARSMLEKAAEANTRYGIDPTYRAVKGVAGVMSGRYVDAINDLSSTGLENAPHAAVWRGLARTELGHWEAARAQFGLAGAVIDAFDDDLRTLFRSRAAKASLRGGDLAAAQHYAEGFPAAPPGKQAKAEILLVNAMIADARGGKEEAVRRYEAAIANGYPPVAARARFGKAVLLHKAGELDDEAYAKELESLRFAWRGDDLELDVLTQLAALRLEQGEIADALKLMQIATANYPDSDEAHRMNMRMSDIFADYFLSEKANEMPPVQALAFFDAFKELTPIGSKGDEMIRHLAERLVAVDLLPQAEHLLDYQVANRLHGGIAKAQVAARLAAIYLLDQKADRALAALRATKQNLLPEALAERRRLLEARALADLKQYDNALDLLEEKTDDLSVRLRVDVLWDSGRWQDAGPAIEALLGDAWKTEEPLSDEMRLLVMRGAIAYSLAGEEGGLSRLRTKFGEAMAASPDASAFAIVSDPIVQQGVAFREMASRIASIDTLDRFLASLKTDDATVLN